jgi:hypothetical protein
VDHKNDRFKVVKIESTEPFKRGRWMCMDYLDHTTLQAQDDGTDGSSSRSGGEETKEEGGNENSTNKVLLLNNGDHVISDNEDLDFEVNKINSKNHHASLLHHTHHHQPHNEASHPQTLTSIPFHAAGVANAAAGGSVTANTNIQAAQSMPQAQIEHLLHQEKLDMHSMSERNNQLSGEQQLPAPPQQLSSPNFVTSQQSHQQHHAQTMTQEMIHACVLSQEQLPQQTQSNNFHHHQGVTLPSNILMQNIAAPQQQSHQLISPNSFSNAALPMTPNQSLATPIPNNNNNCATPTTTISQPNVINVSENSSLHGGAVESAELTNLQDATIQTNQFQNSHLGTGDNSRMQNESDNINNNINNTNQQEILSNSSDNNNMMTTTVVTVVNNNDGQNIASPSSSAGGTVAEGGSVIASENNNESSNVSNSATVAEGGDGQAASEDTER